eukprot:569203-Prymnesium_polylepis.1
MRGTSLLVRGVSVKEAPRKGMPRARAPLPPARAQQELRVLKAMGDLQPFPRVARVQQADLLRLHVAEVVALGAAPLAGRGRLRVAHLDGPTAHIEAVRVAAWRRARVIVVVLFQLCQVESGALRAEGARRSGRRCHSANAAATADAAARVRLVVNLCAAAVQEQERAERTSHGVRSAAFAARCSPD